MLIIECPYCGERAETEFSYGGEGGIYRPLNTESMSDLDWGNYVFMRSNPKGLHHEKWNHSAGCKRWFNALRDTVSYRFVGVWKVGEEPSPAVSEALAARAKGVQA
jgi:sarcosine oxidase subunit delta